MRGITEDHNHPKNRGPAEVTDDQIKILKHLAGVMGWKPPTQDVGYPVYFVDAFTAIVFSTDDVPNALTTTWDVLGDGIADAGRGGSTRVWNPFLDANTAADLVEYLNLDCFIDWLPKKKRWHVRLAKGGATLYVRRSKNLSEAITFACYRATGGTEL